MPEVPATRTVFVEPKPLIRLNEAERLAVGVAAQKLGRLVESSVEL